MIYVFSLPSVTLGYRDIIQTIKNLLEAIENGTRRFAEEIEYMDISKECSKFGKICPSFIQNNVMGNS